MDANRSNERATTSGVDYIRPGESSISLAKTLGPFRLRFLLAALYFLVIFLIGSVGYVLIERWGFLDALYMAVTTVTSVGFMEVRPLTSAGRSFTMVLIALGVTGLGIWWALTTALIVELDLAGVLRRRKMMNRVEALSDHFIVCGAGRMGRVVIAEMAHDDIPFVVIERNPDRVAAVAEDYPDLLIIEGDATKETVLETAKVRAARGLASCLADDADNLLVCLTARGLNPRLTMVARAYNEESMDKLRRAGADHVISPNVTGGIRMASTLLRPSIVSFLDIATRGSDIELRLEEVRIPENSRLEGQSLADARIPQRTGMIVLALRRRDSDAPPTYNPGPELQLSAGDVMIVLGRPEQVQNLREYVGAGVGV